MAETIEIQIQLDDGTLKRGFIRAEKQAKKSSDKIASSFNPRKLFSGITSQLFSIKGLIAGLGAGFAVKGFVDAARKQEDAVNQLNQSLKSAGTFSREASESFQSWASELQKAGTIGDEVSLSMAALARNFTQTNDQAKRLTEAAIELSAATGGKVSIESAITNLGKSMGGLLGELGELVPATRELTQEQLKSGAAIDFVLKRFAGSESAKLQTFTGALAQLQNTFGDFIETLGQSITKSPVVIELIKLLTQQFQTLSGSINTFNKSGDLIGAVIVKVIQFGEAVNRFAIAPIETLVGVFKLAANGLFLAFGGLAGSISGLAGEIIGVFDESLGAKFKAFSEGIHEEGQLVIEDIKTTYRDGLDNAFSDSVGQFLGKAADVAMAALQSGKKVGESFTEGVKDKFKEGVQEVSKELQNLENQINNSIRLTAVNIVKAGMASIGEALVKGGDAFGNFKNVVLNILGDFAIQVGGLLIAQGLAIDALKTSLLTLQGGAAIAAGAALIALGGALKSLASTGPGGGAAGATVAGGGATITPEGGVAEGIGGDDTQSQIDTVSETVGREERQIVNINVTGDILNTEESGLKIVELLNQTFDNADVKLRTGLVV